MSDYYYKHRINKTRASSKRINSVHTQACNNKEVHIKTDSYFIDEPINKLSILIENKIFVLKRVNSILIEY